MDIVHHMIVTLVLLTSVCSGQSVSSMNVNLLSGSSHFQTESTAAEPETAFTGQPRSPISNTAPTSRIIEPSFVVGENTAVDSLSVSTNGVFGSEVSSTTDVTPPLDLTSAIVPSEAQPGASSFTSTVRGSVSSSYDVSRTQGLEHSSSSTFVSADQGHLTTSDGTASVHDVVESSLYPSESLSVTVSTSESASGTVQSASQRAEEVNSDVSTSLSTSNADSTVQTHVSSTATTRPTPAFSSIADPQTSPITIPSLTSQQPSGSTDNPVLLDVSTQQSPVSTCTGCSLDPSSTPQSVASSQDPQSLHTNIVSSFEAQRPSTDPASIAGSVELSGTLISGTDDTEALTSGIDTLSVSSHQVTTQRVSFVQSDGYTASPLDSGVFVTLSMNTIQNTLETSTGNAANTMITLQHSSSQSSTIFVDSTTTADADSQAQQSTVSPTQHVTPEPAHSSLESLSRSLEISHLDLQQSESASASSFGQSQDLTMLTPSDSSDVETSRSSDVVSSLPNVNSASIKIQDLGSLSTHTFVDSVQTLQPSTPSIIDSSFSMPTQESYSTPVDDSTELFTSTRAVISGSETSSLLDSPDWSRTSGYMLSSDDVISTSTLVSTSLDVLDSSQLITNDSFSSSSRAMTLSSPLQTVSLNENSNSEFPSLSSIDPSPSLTGSAPLIEQSDVSSALPDISSIFEPANTDVFSHTTVRSVTNESVIATPSVSTSDSSIASLLVSQFQSIGASVQISETRVSGGSEDSILAASTTILVAVMSTRVNVDTSWVSSASYISATPPYTLPNTTEYITSSTTLNATQSITPSIVANTTESTPSIQTNTTESDTSSTTLNGTQSTTPRIVANTTESTPSIQTNITESSTPITNTTINATEATTPSTPLNVTQTITSSTAANVTETRTPTATTTTTKKTTDNSTTNATEPSLPTTATTPISSTSNTSSVLMDALNLIFYFRGDCNAALASGENRGKIKDWVLKFLSNATKNGLGDNASVGKLNCKQKNIHVELKNIVKNALVKSLVNSFSDGNWKNRRFCVDGQCISLTRFDVGLEYPMPGEETSKEEDIMTGVIAAATCLCIVILAAGAAFLGRDMYKRQRMSGFFIASLPESIKTVEKVPLRNFPYASPIYSTVEMYETKTDSEGEEAYAQEKRLHGGLVNPGFSDPAQTQRQASSVYASLNHPSRQEVDDAVTVRDGRRMSAVAGATVFSAVRKDQGMSLGGQSESYGLVVGVLGSSSKKPDNSQQHHQEIGGDVYAMPRKTSSSSFIPPTPMGRGRRRSSESGKTRPAPVAPDRRNRSRGRISLPAVWPAHKHGRVEMSSFLSGQRSGRRVTSPVLYRGEWGGASSYIDTPLVPAVDRRYSLTGCDNQAYPYFPEDSCYNESMLI